MTPTAPDPGTPVVFLHAFPLNGSMWEPQLAATGSRSCLAPHFPGFGGRAPEERELEAFAQTALGEMDEAGIDQAVIVGLSMGGYVAFRLHALAPERVAGMVLADTRSLPDDEAGRAKRDAQAAMVRAEGMGGLSEGLVPALLGKTTLQARPQVVARVRAMVEAADPEGVARALEAMRERPDSTPSLGEIRCPTLIIVGEEDTLTPPDESREMAARIEESHLVVLPGAGHLSNLETPAAFNEVLLGFLG